MSEGTVSTVKSSSYGDTKLHSTPLSEAEACIGFDNERLVLTGRFGVTVVDSAKFGKQFQLCVYSKEPVKREVRNRLEFARHHASRIAPP